MNFRKLEIYGLAHELVLSTYDLIEPFPKEEDNNLTSQIRRAVTCLPLNIAEGSGAKSNKIFLNFLIFCYRSCMELDAALNLARDLGYISKEKFAIHYRQLDKFIRKLYKYMEYLEGQCGCRKKDKSYFYRHEKYKADKAISKRERMSYLV